MKVRILPFLLVAVAVVQVQVVISVFLALHHKCLVVPGQEHDGVLRLYILGMNLAVELACKLTCCGVVPHQGAVVLTAVEFKHVDILVVGTPCNVGEITVGGVSGVDVCDIAACHVVDTHGNQVGCLSCHGVGLGSGCSDILGAVGGLGNIDERVIGHHALVHAVECHLIAGVVPENATVDAKLVAVHTLGIDNLLASVGSDLVLITLCIFYPQVVVAHKGCGAAGLVPFLHAAFALGALYPHGLVCLHVYEDARAVGHHNSLGFSRVGETEPGKVLHLLYACPSGNLVAGEQQFLAGSLGVDDPARVTVYVQGFVAHPHDVAVLRHHVTVVCAAEVEVLERELLLCCGTEGSSHHERACK